MQVGYRLVGRVRLSGLPHSKTLPGQTYGERSSVGRALTPFSATCPAESRADGEWLPTLIEWSEVRVLPLSTRDLIAVNTIKYEQVRAEADGLS